METPGALAVARIAGVSVPSVIVPGVSVPVCVVTSATPCASETPCVRGVFASVPECVRPGTPCVKGAPQAEETTCAQETARVCEQPCRSEGTEYE